MAMLYRSLSYPPSKVEFIYADGEEPVCLAGEAVDENNERGSSPRETAAASPAPSASSSHVNTPIIHQKAVCCQKSPFGLPAIQLCVMEDVDAEPHPATGDARALAEDVLPQPSCGLGASPPRPEHELPATPAEPAAQPAEPIALPERNSTTSLALVNVDAAPIQAVDPWVQLLWLTRATPAASSVCWHGAGDEDTEDGDDAAEEVTTTAAAAAGRLKRESLGCPPATSDRGTATSTADETSEAHDSAEEEDREEQEPEPVQAVLGGRRLSSGTHQEPSASGHLCPEGVDEGGYRAVAELPCSRNGGALGAGRSRRGRLASAAQGPQRPMMSARGARRAAAAEAAAVVAAAALNDNVDDEAEDEGDDGDEEYTVRGRAGGAGVKRGRRGGAPAKRTAGRLVSGNCCLECGVTETPQWREGPHGARTLCNACGVRYKKARAARQRR